MPVATGHHSSRFNRGAAGRAVAPSIRYPQQQHQQLQQQQLQQQQQQQHQRSQSPAATSPETVIDGLPGIVCVSSCKPQPWIS